MVRFITLRPVAVTMAFIALITLGVFLSKHLPSSLLPAIDIPRIDIIVSSHNSSAKDLEMNFVSNIRRNLQHLNGLLEMESECSSGSAKISLIFNYKTNMSLAYLEVNEKIDKLMGSFPRDMERPLVSKPNISDIPALHLQICRQNKKVTEKGLIELSDFATNIVKRRLEQLDEVALVDVAGKTSGEIHISPKTERLKSLGIGGNDLISIFDNNNIKLSNIKVEDNQSEYQIFFKSEIHGIEELKLFPVRVGNSVFPLSDLANIKLKNLDRFGMIFTNGNRAVDLALVKHPSAEVNKFEYTVSEVVKSLSLEYPDLTFNVSENQTDFLKSALSNLKQDLWLGGLLAFACVFVFIKSIRSALLIVIAIPVTLLLTQIAFYLFNISFNIISLGGLILGLGMVIDNSIVVIESINIQQAKQKSTLNAIVSGTTEVIFPLIASVLTNCAVFVPLLFISGLASALFFDQAASVIISIILSFLVAIILIPPLFLLTYRVGFLRKGGDNINISEKTIFSQAYDVGINWVFKNRKYTLFIIFLVFTFGIYCFFKLEITKFPKIQRADVEICIDWNEHIEGPEAAEYVTDLLRPYKRELFQSVFWIGRQQYILSGLRNMEGNQCRIYLMFKDLKNIEFLTQKIKSDFNTKFKDSKITINESSNPFNLIFPDSKSKFTLKIYDGIKNTPPDIEYLKKLRENILLIDSTIYIPPIALRTNIMLSADYRKTKMYGIDMNNLERAINSSFSKYEIGTIIGAFGKVSINSYPSTFSNITDALNKNSVLSTNGSQYQLSKFVSIKKEVDFEKIWAGFSGEYYKMDIDANSKSQVDAVINYMSRHMNDKIKSEFSGDYFDNRKLLNEMLFVTVVSIILLYFILAAQFESLLQPLFILIELPIDIMGAIILLKITGNTLNMMSMIGIIIMCGLVINDSILKIDSINHYIKTGLDIRQAIHHGGLRRLKPMLMITFTSVGTLLPTFFMSDLGSSLQKPLAVTLISFQSKTKIISTEIK